MFSGEIQEAFTKLILSVVVGLIIGGEREYRNKSAGLRTIILICVGSTVFTILSTLMADESEAARIASNIVTGIGFLGAGAILRDGLTISGLTTASTIWVAAALGMAVGAGEYLLAFAAVGIVFVVLTGFTLVEERMFRIFKKTVELHIRMNPTSDDIGRVEEEMKKHPLKFSRKKEFVKDACAIYHYEVIGRDEDISRFISALKQSEAVKDFEY